MSIEILTGVPGAGKTYYAVHKIRKILSNLDDKCLVLHNIEGLKIEDNRCISTDWDLSFFSSENMASRLRSLRVDYKLSSEDIIHIYVDEAQRFFPPELKDQNVLYFFDYHRHFGVNVTLITQHEKKLTYKITTLAEIEIRAVNNRVNPFGSSFVYKLSSGGEQFGTERLSKDKSIFLLYTSFQAGTGKSKKSSLRYIVLFIILLAILIWIVFFKVFAHSFGLDKDKSLEIPQKKESVKQDFLKESKVRVDHVENVSPEDKVEEKTKYLGEEIEDYSCGRDSLLISDNATGLKSWVLVKDYIKQFPPMVYGYGYFHAPGKSFVMFSGSNNEIIYPVKNTVFVRTFIKTEKSIEPEVKENVYPLEYDNLPNTLQDKNGYTKEDYKKVYAQKRGWKYESKKDESSVNLPVINSTVPHS